MQVYRPGDVVILEYPFASGGGAKPRPAVVLADTGDADVVVIPATTQGQRSEYDVEVADLVRAGLDRVSRIRTHKPQTVEKGLITRRAGRLADHDWDKVAAAVRQWTALVR